MDITKAQVIDGVLWPPNSIDIRDILTLGRVFTYDTPISGMIRLTVYKIDETFCYTVTSDSLNYKDRWVDLNITNIHL